MNTGTLSERLARVSAAMDDFRASLGIMGPSPRVEVAEVRGTPEVRVQTRIKFMTDIVVDLRKRYEGLKRGREEEEQKGKENTAEAEEVPLKRRKLRKSVTFGHGPWGDKYDSPDGHPDREGVHEPSSLGREYRTSHVPQELPFPELVQIIEVLNEPPEDERGNRSDPSTTYQWSIKRIQEQKGLQMRSPPKRPFATPQPKLEARKLEDERKVEDVLAERRALLRLIEKKTQEVYDLQAEHEARVLAARQGRRAREGAGSVEHRENAGASLLNSGGRRDSSRIPKPPRYPT